MNATGFTHGNVCAIYHGMSNKTDDKSSVEDILNKTVVGKAGQMDDKTVIRSASESGDGLTPSRPQYQPPYIVVVDGPRAGAHFPLTDGQNVIGRSEGCVIRLEDQSVSRQHAEITKNDSGWMLKDLGSKNGSSVNGHSVVEPIIIGHKDVVKVGIYRLRLIIQPTDLEDEMKLPPDVPPAVSDRTVFVSTSPDAQTSQIDATSPEIDLNAPDGAKNSDDSGGEDDGYTYVKDEFMDEERPKVKSRRQVVLVILLVLTMIATGTYLFGKKALSLWGKGNAAKIAVSEKASPKVPAVPPQNPVLPSKPKIAPKAIPSVVKVPVFLDFASSPMPAEVEFQGKKLGKTPLRVNMELEPDKTYEVNAKFDMPEIQEHYVQKMQFRIEKDSTVIPILFRAPIGMIKIDDIPRDVDSYLEGKFSYDKFNERTAKLTEIVLNKPIYIPYGKYFIELRRSKKLAVTSQTFVSDIIFHRDFIIAEDNPTFKMSVTDADLSVFPVKIHSEPNNADVYIDGRKVGKTPYAGVFPIGEHRFVLRKDGYFDHSEKLKVDINTPFIANVKLKTSVAGAHINNAQLAMDRQMYQDAINELAEALSSNPVALDVAKAKYMLGICYLKLNDIQRAMGYFDQAKQNDAWKYKAMLGLVRGYAMMKKEDKALPILVEVMLRSKDDDIKSEATDLFQKISPFRSVMYVYSEPVGAKVVVNGKTVGQRTPLILHELSLGNYRLHIEKEGYLPADLNISLSVNEFNPVIVKLKPIPR